jgi:hypothetical protein
VMGSAVASIGLAVLTIVLLRNVRTDTTQA